MLFHVFPVSDGKSRRLHTALDEIGSDLDSSGDKVIYWDDIGHPYESGQRYREVISAEQKVADEADVANYEEGVAEIGGDRERYRWTEVDRLGDYLGIQTADRPCLIIRPFDPFSIDPMIVRLQHSVFFDNHAIFHFQKTIPRSFNADEMHHHLRSFVHRPEQFYDALFEYTGFLSSQFNSVGRVCNDSQPTEPIIELGETLFFPYLGGLQCSKDFRSVRHRGDAYRFDKDQAKVIEYLCMSSLLGPVPCRQGEIAKGTKMRGVQLRDLFKRHPAVDVLLKNQGSGFWILVS